MGISDINRRFNNLLGRTRRRAKPVDEALEDMEQIYDDSIKSIDEMIRWINYYSKDPKNPQYEPIDHGGTKFRLTSLNNEVEDAPKIVKRPYIKYRRENKLLTGEETTINMMKPSVGLNKWNRFCRQSKKHKNFLEELRSIIKEAKAELKDAKDELERKKYDRKAMEQRDEEVKIDRDEILPDKTPETIRDKTADKLDERLQEQEEECQDENEDVNPSMMTPRQFIHYIIMHLKHSRGERSEYYHTLKKGFPKQSRRIESEIYTVSDVRTIDNGDDKLLNRPLSDQEFGYIRDRVNEDGEISETLERHKETA